MAAVRWDESLHARLCAAYVRALRLGALRALAVVSAAVWAQGATRLLPATVAWIVGLAGAMLAALALAYAVLELVWDRRAARAASSHFRVSLASSLRDDTGAGLLCAWGVVSLAPCAAALGARVPPAVTAAISPVALALIALRIALEYAETRT